ncbi:alanine dehydrogenase [Poriferisphaera sp. WC338]|uniref:alanine dehydrogenase n=1 Tax=Poriferisphaera sp. WC338 TaxID=3425129 RepID=UPI003D817BA9
MKIGTIKEIKTHEYRVGLTPACVKAYISRGHEVTVEKGAGEGAGFSDEQYTTAGAQIFADKKAIFDHCDMIVKVKEPLPEEFDLFREGQLLYTYLHLAAAEELTHALMKKKVQGVAYETIETPDGALPCLRPMSAIAGRLSIQEGAKYLEKTYGGRGVLLGGVPGISRGKVAVIGGGEVGLNAAKMAVGLGAEVTILDVSANRLSYLDDVFGGHVTTLYSNDANIEKVVRESDLIVGAVLLPGKKAPHLIKREHLKMMKKGAVIADVAVDQGGCFETTKATTHSDPIFVIDDVVHYCVANMPGAVARSSTLALTSTTLPYGLLLAEKGLKGACEANKDLIPGVNVYDGRCTYEGVAEAFGLAYTPLSDVL